MYDILIVGAGTAGLTAAIYARRAGKSVLVIEGAAFGGQITSSPLVENYPGIPAVSGMDYAEALTAQAKALGAETKFGRVSQAEQIEGGFRLTVGKKTFEGKSLILATGAKHRHLGLENEESYVGRGLSYCAVCDGAFYKGKHTAVVGGGDTALQSALYLSSLCKKVTLIHRRKEFRGQAANLAAVQAKENIEFALEETVTAVQAEPMLSSITLKSTVDGSTRELAVDGLFVAVGQEPDNAPFAHLVDLDESGYFLAGEDCTTKTPGVYVAGDCRHKDLRQLTTAAADGAVAATAASSR